MSSIAGSFVRIDCASAGATAGRVSDANDLVVISAGGASSTIQTAPGASDLLAEALRLLRPGGLLFIYGAPEELSLWGDALLATPELAAQAIFKYWIAIDLNEQARAGFLPPNHRGLVLFVKRDPARKAPPQFQLNVKEL